MEAQTSELSAVNTMLRSIGEAPVSTLEDSELVDAHMAYQTLAEVSREVQAQGWAWNTERDKELKPDSDGHIDVPSNTLSLKPVRQDAWRSLVLRGKRVRDTKENTETFKSPIRVELVMFLQWDDLTELARRYFTVRAGRQFQTDVVGSQTLFQFKQQDELRALLALEEEEAEIAGYNMADSAGVAAVLDRNHPRNF